MTFSHSQPSLLIQRLDLVRGSINRAALSFSRDPASITLVAVSKTRPFENIASLASHGHCDFGENYVQEALPKIEALSDPSLTWHFIGHLQSRKAKLVVARFHLIHTVDSLKLAHALHDSAQSRGLRQAILIQVNIGQEVSKSGVSETDAPALVESALALPGLDVKGLMCLPPFFDVAEQSRPFFARLRALRDSLQQRFGHPLPHLSMGMSFDHVQAIEEGATIVRIGTDIFGPRLCQRGAKE